MSMSQPQDEFKRLRQLLALKRHEQPPPGYFQNFSHQVMARINAVEGDAESAWVLRLWHYLTARPFWSGLAAAGACGVLVGGLMMLRTPDPVAANTLLPMGHNLPGITAPAAGVGGAASFAEQLAQGGSPHGAASEPNSTNPVAGNLAPPSLFFTPKLQVEKASFSPNQ
ncbi:hypothetical protein NXS98_07805 [Fontisphaera persica]|uniref:hypothetical protein n=1 Tax=Fontisphaera persica TaxID=2974023 RepID=UPI0024BF426E|nr:hypothetical protein [Fontisphaera persica]WCJ61012.1 hypothetical protein NXS98_07805 [Fontisphaera persica]